MRALELRNVTSGYGDIIVVRDLSFGAEVGGVVALLGRNGAGKTTTLRTIAGLLRPSSGTVALGGIDVTTHPPYRRTAAGLAFVQEGKRIFRGRTVEENLVLGAFVTKLRRRQLAERIELAYARFPILADRRRERAGSLSGGQQQMLAIAQTLMHEPRVLLLDEPSAGLAPSIVEEVYEVVSQLRDSGLTIVLVEQSVGWATSVADHILVIEIGRCTYSGMPHGPEAEAAMERLHLDKELAPEPATGESHGP